MRWLFHHRAVLVLLLFAAGVAGAAVLRSPREETPILIYDEEPRSARSQAREQMEQCVELLRPKLERIRGEKR